MIPTVTPTSEAIGEGHAAPWLWPWLGGLTIAVVTTIAYWPALTGSFVWDDDWLILNNKVVRAPDGLWRMWFSTDPNYYWPVTNSVFWIEWRLFGTETLGYHLVNLALHIGAALLIWRILFKLGIPGGFLAALLWAVHPVNVEGVAWISQLKTVLSTVFCLLSILCYLHADSQFAPDDRRRLNSSGWLWYSLSILAFLLGMLSKASIAPLPLILLLIVWWRRSSPEALEGRRGALETWDIARLIPFVIIAAALVPVNMWFETKGSGEVFREASFFERLAGAGTVPWFYLAQALVPWNLMFIHPMWSIDATSVIWWLPFVACVVVTTLLVWQRNTWWGRPLLFAWAFFICGLIPVLGFTDVSLMKYTLVSDHYQYLSLIAVTALVGAVLTHWFQLAEVSVRWLPPLVATCAVAALSVLTWVESGTYRNVGTLLQATIDRNATCWVARCGLGIALVQAKQYEPALPLFDEAARLNPKYPEAQDHWGRTLILMNRFAEAVPHLERAIELDPDYAAAHNNLGSALVSLGRLPEAIHHFERALQCNPLLLAARRNLAAALFKSGQSERAMQEWQIAIIAEPDRADSHNDLGVALLSLRRHEEAIGEFQRALELNPQLALAYMNLGHALLREDRPREALDALEHSVQLQPQSAQSWSFVAAGKQALGEHPEALAAAQRVLQLAQAQGDAALVSQLQRWLADKGANPAGAPSDMPLPPSALPPGSDAAPGSALPPAPALPPGS